MMRAFGRKLPPPLPYVLADGEDDSHLDGAQNQVRDHMNRREPPEELLAAAKAAEQLIAERAEQGLCMPVSRLFPSTCSRVRVAADIDPPPFGGPRNLLSLHPPVNPRTNASPGACPR